MEILHIFYILWFITGIAIFIKQYTKEFDFTFEAIPIAIGCGILGLVTVVIFWDSIFPRLSNYTIIKRRKQKKSQCLKKKKK